jgi:dihydrofolate reductase
VAAAATGPGRWEATCQEVIVSQVRVRIGGGPSTIREFLAAGLIDYLHIAVVPIVLGRGPGLTFSVTVSSYG